MLSLMKEKYCKACLNGRLGGIEIRRKVTE
jgi:hypothetical protein